MCCLIPVCVFCKAALEKEYVGSLGFVVGFLTFQLLSQEWKSARTGMVQREARLYVYKTRLYTHM